MHAILREEKYQTFVLSFPSSPLLKVCWYQKSIVLRFHHHLAKGSGSKIIFVLCFIIPFFCASSKILSLSCAAILLVIILKTLSYIFANPFPILNTLFNSHIVPNPILLSYAIIVLEKGNPKLNFCWLFLSIISWEIQPLFSIILCLSFWKKNWKYLCAKSFLIVRNLILRKPNPKRLNLCFCKISI